MKRNLRDSACSQQLIDRIGKLQPGTPPLWGRMTATEMLLHCNRVNEQLLESPPVKKGTAPKQYIARWLYLYVKPIFPKNIPTPKRNDTKGAIDDAAFEAERNRFIALLSRFPTHAKPISLPHPYFGDLNTNQWGIFGYKHMDHHLRQFGL